MAVVGRVGEHLARSINRRTALKKAAAALFGAVAAFSVEGMRRNQALADHCRYVTTGDCSCNPPYGEYCARLDPSFCSGSSCSGGCEFDESWRYVGACWCSATCSYTTEVGTQMRGYYKCCDCNCYGTSCACREFIEGESSHGNRQPGGNVPSFPNSGGSTTPPTFPSGGVQFPPGFPFDNDD
jgi:hypothetical protein